MNPHDEPEMGPLLSGIGRLADFKSLDEAELPRLAEEIRAFLVGAVARTGGHIGPNLGVVELTMAIHRVFDSPHDQLVFDTGHQSYVHKALTGRAGQFAGLRGRGGLTGYPSQAESPHDLVENSHASTSLSYADGLAKAHALAGSDRHVVAVVGDGALTGGMCWEALNNIAARDDLKLVIVVNDNGRSYAPTVGGLAKRLSGLRLNPGYEPTLRRIQEAVEKIPVFGRAAYAGLHAAKTGLKDALAPQGMFADLGIKYVGPVDGHDIAELTEALERAKGFGGPVIVHALTEKGRGWAPARADEAEQMHSPPAFDPITGEPTAASKRRWTGVFADELVAQANLRPELVAITAAMPGPTGVDKLMKRHPERVFDVGIAEQHAVTSAAGLAMNGLHPVVAVYSTFMNRAFDQTVLDVAMHRLPVTFVLDRAGITGPDGPSHYGIWDTSIFRVVPGLRIAAPRDASTLREEFAEALAVDDGPTMLRFPTGAVPAADLPAVDVHEGLDVLLKHEDDELLIVACGSLAGTAVEAAELLAERGIRATVVDPRWISPVPDPLVKLAGQYPLVATVEDGIRTGGFGDALAQSLRDAGEDVPLVDFGVERGWHPHGSRAELLADLGLTADAIAERLAAEVHRRGEDDGHHH
ncbi:1-deoxy-D-xylulose-5-phosphate synthase [Glycomyces sp. A-F 0318]|uniref:1-deoxy-D-xylulose-5-phosphate synthase n=1 Tax=Glycomyces amatae TaxID=2881355 RepID=UPI001E5EBFE2|nr:1-deoxy-D-xylulose-5-phosphate synthase [Glycomyces amatae]MCD0443848.1 1-deoxy-D-xylulose-5-phosphate synthase [Glycomyces amatae]